MNWRVQVWADDPTGGHWEWLLNGPYVNAEPLAFGTREEAQRALERAYAPSRLDHLTGDVLARVLSVPVEAGDEGGEGGGS